MPFSAPFREPNIAPIFSPGGAVIPWYLLGGVTVAQCVAAYQPKGAADLATSYINLNNPGTNNAAPGTAPTFAAATGWTFASASSQYLDTGIVITGTQSVLARLANASGTTHAMGAGQDVTANAFYFGLGWTATQDILSYRVSQVQATVHTAGVIGITPAFFYFDGTQGAAVPAGAFGAATTSFLIGAIHRNDGSRTIFYNGDVLALALYSITLSSTQVGLIAAAMAAL